MAAGDVGANASLQSSHLTGRRYGGPALESGLAVESQVGVLQSEI